jgi:hypothetical protein
LLEMKFTFVAKEFDAFDHIRRATSQPTFYRSARTMA